MFRSLKAAARHPVLMLALAGSTLFTAPTARALDFVFIDTTSGGMTAQQLAAVNAAGAFWSSKLSDPVTVYVQIGFATLGPNILGETGSAFTTASYSTVRTRLASDVTSALDTTAVSHLQTGSSLSFWATQGDLSQRFDNDGSTNNTLLGLTTANAKALGLSVATNTTSPDATMTFSSTFPFSYTRVGGTPGGTFDFITVAEHELGHALGFTSGVDDIDYCAGAANRCGFNNSPSAFEGDWWYEPLDLFRYTSAGLDLRVGGSPYFSVDGGATAIETFSTGQFNGNGYQASHFGTGSLNLMRPFVGPGEQYDASANDLAALDAVGWNLAVAVPEPASQALYVAGLAALVSVVRRRRLSDRSA